MLKYQIGTALLADQPRSVLYCQDTYFDLEAVLFCLSSVFFLPFVERRTFYLLSFGGVRSEAISYIFACGLPRGTNATGCCTSNENGEQAGHD